MNRAFTGMVNKIGAGISSASSTIAVRPVEAIFDATLRPGDSATGRRPVNIANTGNIGLRYWVFAEYLPIPPTTPAEALEAAQNLQLVIRKSMAQPLIVFSGALAELFDKPPGGRFLAPLGAEELQFTLSLPPMALNTFRQACLKINFLFTAEQDEGTIKLPLKRWYG